MKDDLPFMDATPLARMGRYARLRGLQAQWGVPDRVDGIDLATVQAPLLNSDILALLAQVDSQANEIARLEVALAHQRDATLDQAAKKANHISDAQWRAILEKSAKGGSLRPGFTQIGDAIAQAILDMKSR
jgi:hypothetical protein